ncbi:Piwi-domain-containing protein [Trametopsis cervina]|nr:Piwi-domain-containing protein [Trametopsis cervina]
MSQDRGRGGRGRGGGSGRGRGGRGDSPGRGGGGGRGGPPPGGFGGGRGGPPGGSGGGRGGPSGGFGGRGGGPAAIFAANTRAVVDPSLSDAALDKLVSSFRRLEVRAESPVRPGWGTVGRPITLRSNFFALKLPKNMQIFDYDVAIAPPEKEKDKDLSGPRKAQIFELLQGSPEFAPYVGFIAHDRSQRVVSVRQLPQPLVVRIQYREQGETQARAGSPEYTVTVTYVRTLDLNEMTPHLEGRQKDYDGGPIVSALNMIIQKHANQAGAVRVGQNKYFFLTGQSFGLDLGLEARRGYFMSVRPAFTKLMVNINVAMTAFYSPGNLAEAMIQFRNVTGAIPNKFFEKLRIVTTHLGYPRKRPLFQIMQKTSRKQTFPCEELGGTVSVEQYFQRKYNIRLQHADDLPVVNVGTRDRPNFLPPEICEIFPGQAFRGELPPNATRNMIEVACNAPADNANWIVNEGLPLLGLKTDTSTLDRFGLAVSPDMSIVPARVLNPPRVTYKAGAPPNVRDASWNILNVKFHKGGDMSRWGVLLVQEGRRDEFKGSNDPALTQFLQTFAKKCSDSGMTTANVPPTIMVTDRLPRPMDDPGRKRALEIIRQTIIKNLNPKQKPQFILVLLSGEDKFIYPGMKRMCDMVLGLHTVFMLLLPKKAGVREPQKLDQYFSNVCLKVNAKLGGTNHLLASDATQTWLNAKKTMLVGVDVTHPSPTSTKGTPSIVAVVASNDNNFAQFPASLGLQRNRNINKNAEEMVQELTKMMVERLQAYEKNMRSLPERIIVYRDGVSEGQYDLVRDKELPRILDAFKKFDTKARGGSYRPALTIIICGKRHHARFSATAVDHMTRNGNTVPGTVVDKGITSIYGHDFYLQAHNGLKGSVRPTHYNVLYDENKLSADTVQLLTLNLSYMYARATKGVSLVPPAYYADIACERGRTWLNMLMDVGGGAGSVSSRTSGEAERQRVYDQAAREWGNGIHADLKESMFYI